MFIKICDESKNSINICAYFQDYCGNLFLHGERRFLLSDKIAQNPTKWV